MIGVACHEWCLGVEAQGHVFPLPAGRDPVSAVMSSLVLCLAGYSILGCMFFSFRTLNIFCQPFLACQVSVERSAVTLIFLPIKVRDFFSLAALRIFSLSLEFASFTIKCGGVERFLLILGGESLYFLDLNARFPSQIRKVFS